MTCELSRFNIMRIHSKKPPLCKKIMQKIQVTKTYEGSCIRCWIFCRENALDGLQFGVLKFGRRLGWKWKNMFFSQKSTTKTSHPNLTFPSVWLLIKITRFTSRNFSRSRKQKDAELTHRLTQINFDMLLVEGRMEWRKILRAFVAMS